MFRSLKIRLLVLGMFPIALSATSAHAQGNPEQGDVRVNTQTRFQTGPTGSTEVRLAMQGRLDAVNLVRLSRPGPGSLSGGGLGAALMTPIMTPGVRLVGTRLFLGLGLGFSGSSTDDEGDEASQTGLSMVPTVSYDILTGPSAALSVGGMLTLASLGETEVCDSGDCINLNNDAFGLGLSALVGVRGMIGEALAIGTEFGWGFLTVSADSDPDQFIHGLLGMIVFEASIGL